MILLQIFRTRCCNVNDSFSPFFDPNKDLQRGRMLKSLLSTFVNSPPLILFVTDHQIRNSLVPTISVSFMNNNHSSSSQRLVGPPTLSPKTEPKSRKELKSSAEAPIIDSHSACIQTQNRKHLSPSSGNYPHSLLERKLITPFSLYSLSSGDELCQLLSLAQSK